VELTLTLIWKGAAEGRCGRSIRISQLKETLLELGGGTLEETAMLPRPEESKLEIKKTLLLGTSPPKEEWD